MSEVLRRCRHCVALLFAVAAAWGTLARPAEAAVGDVLQTVNIPDAAKCGASSGAAVAVVPGGKLNVPKIQTMLVTSCVQAGQAKLFFLDPSTDPATLVKTINTSVTPANGWESLAARPDRVDLIGCGIVSGAPKVYSIDFSSIPPNTPDNDGGATLLFTGPAGSTCQGLAWDVVSDPKTIYQSASTSPSVRHLSEAGAPVSGAVASGCPGPTTGVAVGVVNSATLSFAGPVLFAACPEALASPPEIRQIKKVDGSPVTSVELPDASVDLTGITSQPGDIECDPVTFGVSQSWHPGIRNTDVLWVKDTDPAHPHHVYAVELPFAACGPVPPPPTPVANACDLTIDTDGDGLPDCWEDRTWWADQLPGIALDGIYAAGRTATSANRFTLCVESNGVSGFQAIECADRFQRDIFVEIDYMEHHRPNSDAVSDVINAFAIAPAFSQVAGSPGVGKCDGAGCTPGIRLHVQIDAQIPHVTNTALSPCTGPLGTGHVDFDKVKAGTAFAPAAGGFGTANERLPANMNLLNAKRLAFHYGLFVHNQSPTPPAASSSSSGCAELFGNDFMVSLGGWAPPVPQPTGHTGGVGSRAEQAGTFIHELGHNLGLRHGGVDNVNCKPQHLSVMNYAYQFPNVVIDRPLTYSSAALGADPTLQCGVPGGIGLNEACLQEALGIGNATEVKIAFGPPTGIPAKTTIAAVSVAPNGPVNWNKDGDSLDVSVVRDLNQMTSSSGGCPASAGGFLEGSNDWQILQLNLRASSDFADGVSQNFDPPVTGGTKEATVDDALDLSHDIIDIKPNDRNNTVHLGTTGTFEVAIFSRRSADGTTVDVDATTIDPSSITLRGLPPGPEWSLTVRGGGDCKMQDMNKDGVADLVCKFRWDPGPVVSSGNQRAALTGTTSPGGYDFLSADMIRFVQ